MGLCLSSVLMNLFTGYVALVLLGVFDGIPVHAGAYWKVLGRSPLGERHVLAAVPDRIVLTPVTRKRNIAIACRC